MAVVDLAGRTRIDMVKCLNCPWREGCPDQCKRGDEAKPNGIRKDNNQEPKNG